jgi:hypothetical protein
MGATLSASCCRACALTLAEQHEAGTAVSARQAGVVSRAQLTALGIDRFTIRNQVAAERWVLRSSTVVSTTTGEPTRLQTMWTGVLHAGRRSLLGDLTAAELAGLRNWHRDLITVLVPDDLDLDDDVSGVHFARTRRPLSSMQEPAAPSRACASSRRCCTSRHTNRHRARPRASSRLRFSSG